MNIAVILAGGTGTRVGANILVNQAFVNYIENVYQYQQKF